MVKKIIKYKKISNLKTYQINNIKFYLLSFHRITNRKIKPLNMSFRIDVIL